MKAQLIATHSFQDVAGEIYLVDEYKNVVKTGTMAQSQREDEVSRTLRLRDGRAVRYIDDDTYEIVEGNIRITRI